MGREAAILRRSRAKYRGPVGAFVAMVVVWRSCNCFGTRRILCRVFAPVRLSSSMNREPKMHVLGKLLFGQLVKMFRSVRVL